MYSPKIINRHALPFIMAILIALLLCCCRSTHQHSSLRINQQKDSSSVKLSEKAHGSITSQSHTRTDINGNKWKITYHFDTSKPSDPSTGLPPTSQLEIEGSEIHTQVEGQENVSSETSGSVSYHHEQAKSSSAADRQDDSKQKATGTSIEKSIAAGIILITFTLAIILYVRSHSSKQNNRDTRKT